MRTGATWIVVIALTAAALERLASVSNMMFDKTGTLTYGTPKVIAVHSFGNAFSKEDIYRLAAGAEMCSEHPLGKAIVDGYQNQTKQALPQAEEFSIILSMTGVLNPVVGALVHNAGSVMVIANSAILLNWRKKFPDRCQ